MHMHSKEHQEYLKNEKKKIILIHFTQIIIIFILFSTWELLANFKVINTFLFSSPSKIINTIITLFRENNLFNHIGITIYEVMISFLISIIIGIIIATLLWWNKFLSKVVEPFLTILNSLPKVALGPLIIIWSGAGIKSIIIMSLLISTFITIINLYQFFIMTNENYIILLKSLKASKLNIFTKVVLPSNKENIISTLKINMSMNFIGLLPPVGEKIFFNKCYSRY